MDTDQHGDTGKKLEQMEARLVRIEIFQIVTLVLVALAFLGLGGLVYAVGWIVAFLALAGGALYFGVWMYERLVQKKIGDHWSEKAAEEFVEEPETDDREGPQP